MHVTYCAFPLSLSPSFLHSLAVCSHEVVVLVPVQYLSNRHPARGDRHPGQTVLPDGVDVLVVAVAAFQLGQQRDERRAVATPDGHLLDVAPGVVRTGLVQNLRPRETDAAWTQSEECDETTTRANAACLDDLLLTK